MGVAPYSQRGKHTFGQSAGGQGLSSVRTVVSDIGSKLLVFSLLATALVMACSNAPGFQEYATTLRCADCPTLLVSRIIDGDTFDSARGRVRLFGVDTPERGERCHRAASDVLEQIAGSLVRVEVGPRGQDRGGRWLYYVYTEAGNSIDEMLVREGLARAWTADGQHRDHLVGLEKEARRSSDGCLW